jgi:hypothetical protein
MIMAFTIMLLLFMSTANLTAKVHEINDSRELTKAFQVCEAGDQLRLADGIYDQPLLLKRNGTKDKPITILAVNPRRAIFKLHGQAAKIEGRHLTISGIVFDSQYADCTCVYAAGQGIRIQNCEILRAGSVDGPRGGDGIQLHDSSDCHVEHCEVHHCLASKSGERVDSHGIRLTHSHDITVSDCIIHMISGDCLQVDPNREAWDNIVITRCVLRGGKVTADDPLAHPRFAPGSYTAENAVDTKCPKQGRPKLTISDCLVSEFRGPIGNAAAFNIKENCEASIDRCTISDSVIGLRLRGPAQVTVTNCVLYDNNTHCRYEDKIPKLHILHCTFGTVTGKGRGFFQEEKPSPDLRVLGCLFLESKPKQAADVSNQAIASDGFANLIKHDYRPARRIPRGTQILLPDAAVLKIDRAGQARSDNANADAGAYQYQPQ